MLAEIINHCDNFIPEDSPQDVYQIIDFSAIIHTKIRFNEFKSNFKKSGGCMQFLRFNDSITTLFLCI